MTHADGIRQPTGREVDVAVIGGGISGLATAYYLLYGDDGTKRADAPRVVVLESTGRLGGKIRTDRVDTGAATPFVVEAGPDSFLTQKPWAAQLARQLGLAGELIGTNDHMRKVYVLQCERLVPMPEGLQLIAPTRWWPFLASPLLSPWGKLRMALDLFLPARRDNEDETLADFVTRRMGREALDKLAEPLMSGIYSAEADRQSLLATFPRFRELEIEHGSVIRGLMAANRARRQALAGKSAPPAFIAPRAGTEALVERLTAALAGHVVTDAQVRALERRRAARDGAPGGYCIRLQDGRTYAARIVVAAVPASDAARIVAELAPAAAKDLGAVRYVSTATLSLGYGPGAVNHPMDGFGVVIPRSEARPINAITWTSTKFEGRAPAGHRLIRVFLGGSRNPDVLTNDDEQLVAIARRELRAIMGIHAAPVFTRLFRWRDASPQYDVGHLDLVARIEANLPSGVLVTGSPYRGLGIPDCVRQAQQTAQRALDQRLQASEAASTL